jgi:hypothetical protein
MKNIKPSALAACALILMVTACRKEINPVDQQQQSTGSSRPAAQGIHDSTPKPPAGDTTGVLPPFPVNTPASASACSFLPIYGDTIIYPQPVSGQDYIFNVVNSPGTGKYFAWPQGMVIDPNTGAINVTKSETGLKYAIGFVKDGTTDTCLSTLVIGGAAYMDSVYVIQDGQKNALPYFDANPYLPPICQGNGCTFDVGGTARQQKVILNTSSGVIDLDKTLNGTLLGLGGAFGLLPVNGSTITTRIYYKLNDASNQALQHIDVQLQYFDTRSAIGPGLLGNVLNKLNNLLSGNMISTSANPRPPLIIIVRR